MSLCFVYPYPTHKHKKQVQQQYRSCWDQCEGQMSMMGIGEGWKGKGVLDWEIACIKGWGNEDRGMGIKTKRGRSGGGAVLCFVNLSG